jgi:hypothetical protein
VDEPEIHVERLAGGVHGLLDASSEEHMGFPRSEVFEGRRMANGKGGIGQDAEGGTRTLKPPAYLAVGALDMPGGMTRTGIGQGTGSPLGRERAIWPTGKRSSSTGDAFISAEPAAARAATIAARGRQPSSR